MPARGKHGKRPGDSGSISFLPLPAPGFPSRLCSAHLIDPFPFPNNVEGVSAGDTFSSGSSAIVTAMGLLAAILDKFCEHCSTQSIWVLCAVGTLSLIAVSVVINVLQQLLFKNPKEPPIVFHWFPFVGSTISYGMDPYKFFFDCRAKVGFNQDHLTVFIAHNFWRLTVWRYLHLHPPRQENYGVSRHQGQRFHSQRQASRCLCRGGVFSPYNTGLWASCRV